MGIKLRYLTNELVLDDFEIEGIPLLFNLSSITVPGRDGEIPPVASEVTIGARNLRVYTTLWSTSKSQRLSKLETLAKFLRTYGPHGFDLFPDLNSDKYFRNVYPNELTDLLLKPLPGLVGDTAAMLKATDPYLYSVKQDYAIDTLGSGTEFVINNSGNYPVRAKVIIKCTLDSLINPSLVLGGATISFMGSLLNDDFLELFESLEAKKNGAGVLASMSNDFLTYGVSLMPGDNIIRYVDHATSSHRSHITLEWYPKTLY